jgi:hypothetical protein
MAWRGMVTVRGGVVRGNKDDKEGAGE